MKGKMMKNNNALIKLNEIVKGIIESDLTWEGKYNLIFSDDISGHIFKISDFTFYDPDSDYEDDVKAFATQFVNYVSKMKKRSIDRNYISDYLKTLSNEVLDENKGIDCIYSALAKLTNLVSPKTIAIPDPYELHGVTREQVVELAKAVELIYGGKATDLSWSKDGKAVIRIKKFVESNKFAPVRYLNRPAPYEHWETPIILGGE